MKFKIRFVLNDRNKAPSELCSISARLYYKKYRYYDTGIMVYPYQFDKKEAKSGGIRVIQKHEQQAAKNDELKAVYDRIDKVVSDFRRSGQPFTAQQVKRKLEHSGKDAVECFLFVLERDQSIVRNTKNAITSMISRLSEYAPGVKIHEIDYPFAKSFESYLLKRPGRYQDTISVSTTVKYIRDLSRMLKKSTKWGFIESNPLDGYDYIIQRRNKKSRTGKNISYNEIDHYTNEDIELLEKTDFQALGFSRAKARSLSLTRYAVLFSCYTGLRLSDWLKVCKDNVTDGVLYYEPEKGKDRRKAPLIIECPIADLFGGKALQILNKVGRFKMGSVPIFGDIARITHQANIRIIVPILFPGRNLKIHSARHSFETRLENLGVDPFTIQRLMGHASVKTTKGYNHSDWLRDHQEIKQKTS